MFAYAYSTAPQGLILAKRFIHSDYKSVANWFPGVYMTLLALPYGAWSSTFQALPDERDLLLIIGDVLCFIPQVAFQRGLGAIMQVSSQFRDTNLSWGDVWSFQARVWLPSLVMLVVGTLEWTYLYRLTTTRDEKTDYKEHELDEKIPIDVSGDPDLSEERGRSHEDNNGINARDLVKVFKVKPNKKQESKDVIIKHAVKGVSYGVRKNEIYALLGPNGSGKTVTMSMLAGELTPDYGEVALDGCVAAGDDKDINHLYSRSNVAYCPQFDALFPKKSVEDHMKFYAAIRGLTWVEKATQEHINAILRLLGLTKHLDKESSELSGGYKRRLSLAIALIGYPNVLLVDECSTGIDPAARREVWDIFKASNHDEFDIPATILSSHYMDECQELGTRIGILIDGQVVTTGSLKRLQELFCTSYFIEVSLESYASKSAEDRLIETFKKNDMIAETYESLPYRFKLRIPFVDGVSKGGSADILQLANIFSILETSKESLGIKFYSVAPMNLEQIFIDLSRKQFDIDANLKDE